MNCDRIQEQLADYLGQELDRPTREAFDDHVKECPTCRVEIQSLTGTLQTLGRLEAPPVRLGDATPRRSSRWQPLRYAAILIFGLCLGWWARPMTQSAVTDRAGVRKDHSDSGGIHNAWIDAALASSPADAEPFARNAVRLIKAFSGQSPPH